MRLLPRRRRRVDPPAAQADQVISARRAYWPGMPPIQRVLVAIEPTAATRWFVGGLSVRRRPQLSFGPLGHRVTAEAPRGTVSDMVAASPPLDLVWSRLPAVTGEAVDPRPPAWPSTWPVEVDAELTPAGIAPPPMIIAAAPLPRRTPLTDSACYAPPPQRRSPPRDTDAPAETGGLPAAEAPAPPWPDGAWPPPAPAPLEAAEVGGRGAPHTGLPLRRHGLAAHVQELRPAPADSPVMLARRPSAAQPGPRAAEIPQAARSAGDPLADDGPQAASPATPSDDGPPVSRTTMPPLYQRRRPSAWAGAPQTDAGHGAHDMPRAAEHAGEASGEPKAVTAGSPSSPPPVVQQVVRGEEVGAAPSVADLREDGVSPAPLPVVNDGTPIDSPTAGGERLAPLVGTGRGARSLGGAAPTADGTVAGTAATAGGHREPAAPTGPRTLGDAPVQPLPAAARPSQNTAMTPLHGTRAAAADDEGIQRAPLATGHAGDAPAESHAVTAWPSSSAAQVVREVVRGEDVGAGPSPSDLSEDGASRAPVPVVTHGSPIDSPTARGERLAPLVGTDPRTHTLDDAQPIARDAGTVTDTAAAPRGRREPAVLPVPRALGSTPAAGQASEATATTPCHATEGRVAPLLASPPTSAHATRGVSPGVAASDTRPETRAVVTPAIEAPTQGPAPRPAPPQQAVARPGTDPIRPAEAPAGSPLRDEAASSSGAAEVVAPADRVGPIVGGRAAATYAPLGLRPVPAVGGTPPPTSHHPAVPVPGPNAQALPLTVAPTDAAEPKAPLMGTSAGSGVTTQPSSGASGSSGSPHLPTGTTDHEVVDRLAPLAGGADARPPAAAAPGVAAVDTAASAAIAARSRGPLPPPDGGAAPEPRSAPSSVRLPAVPAPDVPETAGSERRGPMAGAFPAVRAGSSPQVPVAPLLAARSTITGHRPAAVLQRAPEEVPPVVAAAVGDMLGANLEGVHVRRDDDTEHAAHELRARAFTASGEIHLPARHGAENTGTTALLVHELTHVAQQRRAGGAMPTEDFPAGRLLEGEAQAMEQLWRAGGPSLARRPSRAATSATPAAAPAPQSTQAPPAPPPPPPPTPRRAAAAQPSVQRAPESEVSAASGSPRLPTGTTDHEIVDRLAPLVGGADARPPAATGPGVAAVDTVASAAIIAGSRGPLPPPDGGPAPEPRSAPSSVRLAAVRAPGVPDAAGFERQGPRAGAFRAVRTGSSPQVPVAPLLAARSTMTGHRPAAVLQRAPEEVPPVIAAAVADMLGANLEGVLVRRDDDTEHAAHELRARAFTASGEIHLPARHGALENTGTTALLVHELTHVAQQRRAGGAMPTEDSPAGSRLEGEAQAMEQLWRAGGLSLARRKSPAATSATPAAAPVRQGTQAPPPPSPPPPTPPAAATAAGSGAASQPPVQRAPDSEAATAWSPQAASADELDDLAQRLYGRLRSRLRAELLVDRERAGLSVDMR